MGKGDQDLVPESRAESVFGRYAWTLIQEAASGNPNAKGIALLAWEHLGPLWQQVFSIAGKVIFREGDHFAASRLALELHQQADSWGRESQECALDDPRWNAWMDVAVGLRRRARALEPKARRDPIIVRDAATGVLYAGWEGAWIMVTDDDAHYGQEVDG